MAWQSLYSDTYGSSNIPIGPSNATYGYVAVQYDDSSSEPRSVKIRAVSGNYTVNFNEVYIDGSRIGSFSNITQDNEGFAYCSVRGGRNISVSWYNPWYAGGTSRNFSVYLPAAPDPTTPPSGLTTSLVDFGPDWASIAVHIDSWGNPSGSASRYIEAAILGTSTYGNPYKYDTRTAVKDATIRINNSCRGNLTVTPNTQYGYGGYATNQSKTTNVINGQFTTLPAVPVINAIDQGHGVIDVTVTHATEGSALTVAEEYSIDGGTTWTAITGGAFTVTLSAQTVLTVRRSSTAGASSDTVTVTPSFTTAIYGSVLNKTVEVKHIYASVNDKTKKVKKVYASVEGKTKLVFEDVS